MFCQYIFSYLTQYSRNKSSISCKKKKKKVFVCLFVFDMIAHSLQPSPKHPIGLHNIQLQSRIIYLFFDTQFYPSIWLDYGNSGRSSQVHNMTKYSFINTVLAVLNSSLKVSITMITCFNLLYILVGKIGIPNGRRPRFKHCGLSATKQTTHFLHILRQC